MKVKIVLLIVIVSSIMLAACQSSPEEKISNIIEDTVSKEKVFDEQQEPLVELEKKENEIFNKIMKLGMKDFQDIVRLSDEALENLDKRKQRMEKEEESISESKQEFSKIKKHINEITDEELKQEALDLNSLMQKRYRSHEQLYQAYTKGIESDKKLYEMFKDKNAKLDEIEKQIEKTNEVYSTVLESNKQFNERTKDFNKSKLKFYKKSGLKVNSK